jgi:hypothetical protein
MWHNRHMTILGTQETWSNRMVGPDGPSGSGEESHGGHLAAAPRPRDPPHPALAPWHEVCYTFGHRILLPVFGYLMLMFRDVSHSKFPRAGRSPGPGRPVDPAAQKQKAWTVVVHPHRVTVRAIRSSSP